MRILVVDDEEGMRHMLSVILKKEGCEAATAADGASALRALEKDPFDFILCDIKMPGLDGPGFLRELKKLDIHPAVIMMSAYGTMDTALECMRLGAYDYISKPFRPDEIMLTIRKAEERENLRAENDRLRREAARDYEEIYAADRKMVEVLELVRKVSDYDTTVLVTGETGTGKELIARAIHKGGKRREAPFVAVNCGAIPEELLESELFGHVRGAFTDAVRTKNGLFHEASHGTIFLDEVGELPKELQVKLLRVLQEGEVRRVGDTKSARVDVRVVAATARDLEEEIKKGAFREDLFYRLNVMPVHLPPLRERKGDIPGLVRLFIGRYTRKYSKRIKAAANDAMDALSSYRWPGNIRELENVMERAVILEDTDTIQLKNLPFFKKGDPAQVRSGHDMLSIKKAEEAIERELIKKALEMTNGNKTRAAELLEISHRALLYKVKSYGL
ncbi:MAG: sigma-54-dependent Fis family transcriptional regulator [Deltaproteobacteria bacterium]|nr:sigma-54-dependent Fis family transcriptional regulator [Deltaproteobacteria bacterium]